MSTLTPYASTRALGSTRSLPGSGRVMELQACSKLWYIGGVAQQASDTRQLVTLLGERSQQDCGLILPHEHVFVDLRTPDTADSLSTTPEQAVPVMRPLVDDARTAGVTAMVECTPVGVGRRADIVKAVAEASGMPIVAATGIYREPWVPEWAQEASEGELADWMLQELCHGIESTGSRAGFIKISAGDDGITPMERRILRAAITAAKEVDALIGSHTMRGWVAFEQLQTIEKLGYDPGRYLWIHTHLEQDTKLHEEMVRRGAWIEYDGISYGDDEPFIRLIHQMLDADCVHRLLLSQDRGWYDPAQPDGGLPGEYTHLPRVFLPKLLQSGVPQEIVTRLTCSNPFEAFARKA